MLKTNKLKTLVVLLATILGLTGITSNVYADKASDKKIVARLSLEFIENEYNTGQKALDWANQNTTGRAYQDPYRYSLPGKNPGLTAFNNLGEDRKPPHNSKVKYIKISKDNFHAISLVDYVSYGIDASRGNLPNAMFFSRKIWFKKIDGRWKISDYYTLLTKYTVNGQVTPYPDGMLIKNADKIGTKFPR